MTASRDMSATELWATLLGLNPEARRSCVIHGNGVLGDHDNCVVNQCPSCHEPVTNRQIEDGEALQAWDGSPGEELFRHRKCGKEAQFGRY